MPAALKPPPPRAQHRSACAGERGAKSSCDTGVTTSELFAAGFVHVGGGIRGHRGTLGVAAGVTSETLRGELSLIRQQSTHTRETVRVMSAEETSRVSCLGSVVPGAASCPEPPLSPSSSPCAVWHCDPAGPGQLCHPTAMPMALQLRQELLQRHIKLC